MIHKYQNGDHLLNKLMKSPTKNLMIYLIGIDTFMNILLNNLNIMQISINLWKLLIKKNGKRDLVKEE